MNIVTNIDKLAEGLETSQVPLKGAAGDFKGLVQKAVEAEVKEKWNIEERMVLGAM